MHFVLSCTTVLAMPLAGVNTYSLFSSDLEYGKLTFQISVPDTISVPIKI
jgi:hypothetical protein